MFRNAFKTVARVSIALLGFSTLVFAQTAGSSSLNDAIFAFMGNGGYDALDYKIDLHFSSDKKTVIGITTIEAMATQDLSRLARACAEYRRSSSPSFTSALAF